jgi:hypothetical protein
MFDEEPEFFISKDKFRKSYQDIFATELDYNKESRKFSSNRVKLTEYCKIKIFILRNVIIFCVWGLSVLILGYLLIFEIRKKKNYQIAENLYKCIVLDIHNNSKVSLNPASNL